MATSRRPGACLQADHEWEVRMMHAALMSLQQHPRSPSDIPMLWQLTSLGAATGPFGTQSHSYPCDRQCWSCAPPFCACKRSSPGGSGSQGAAGVDVWARVRRRSRWVSKEGLERVAEACWLAKEWAALRAPAPVREHDGGVVDLCGEPAGALVCRSGEDV